MGFLGTRRWMSASGHSLQERDVRAASVLPRKRPKSGRADTSQECQLRRFALRKNSAPLETDKVVTDLPIEA